MFLLIYLFSATNKSIALTHLPSPIYLFLFQASGSPYLCPCEPPAAVPQPIYPPRPVIYEPQYASQALATNPYGLSAAQAGRRQANLNVQAHITQIGNNNVNAQSDIGQSSKAQRRGNMNVQSGVSQGPAPVHHGQAQSVDTPSDAVEVPASSASASAGSGIGAAAVAGSKKK